MLVVDEYQYAQHDGPCLRAMTTDRTVHMTLEQVKATWPQLAAALKPPVSTRSWPPLRIADRPVGSLNLYSAGLGDVDPDLLTVLTEYLSRGLTDYAEQQPAPTGESLRAALVGRAMVEQAVGVLMASRHLRSGEARDLLRLLAHEAELTTQAQAQRIVDGQLPPTQ